MSDDGTGPKPAAKTISFVSLGCPKNLVDSERMLGLLARDGYTLVPEGEKADLVIINTCGFIDSARQESLGVIREMLERKKAGELKGVLVAGCLAEREKDLLREQVPDVDQILGVHARESIVEIAERIIQGGLDEQRSLFRPAPVRAQEDTARLRITPRHLAYLKVSEGCDRLCTFCAIPFMRGKHVTKPIEEVVREATELAADGVRELNLVAQDMTYYGLDLYGRPRLAELLTELGQIDGLDWIRVLYNYPQFVSDELLEALATTPRVVPYLDMPLQHINDRMLKLMNRRHTRAETELIIARMRAAIPNLVLRTTFIAGFPGETEAEFQELRDFVAETKFQRLGVFSYSFEPDTPAAKLSGHLDDATKQTRVAAIMETQQPIAFGFNAGLVGQTLDVLIDAVSPRGGYQGRTFADAPDVDGVVFVQGSGLEPGDLIACEIIGTAGYDLIARAGERPPSRRKSRPRARRQRPGSSSLLPIVDA